MPLFCWFSKAEHGEQLQPDDDEDAPEFESIRAEDEDDLPDEETTEDFFRPSCADRGGVCPFHAEIPRLH